MNKVKTIRMTREQLDKWLAALRSGKYKQGTGVLYRPSTDSYCCLGVLQHCLTGAVEKESCGGMSSFPSMSWLKEHGVRFSFEDDNVHFAPPRRDPDLRPNPAVPNWLRASHANDRGMSFDQIAQLIEDRTEIIE